MRGGRIFPRTQSGVELSEILTGFRYKAGAGGTKYIIPEKVGDIRQFEKGPATLMNVVPGAPLYIKPLEGKTYKSVPVLLNAIRREAFRHEAKKGNYIQ